MKNSLSNSGIGEQLTLAVLGLIFVGILASAGVLGAAAMDSVGDSEPVGDENTTATSEIAWLHATNNGDSNATTVTAYNETGTVIWESEVRNTNLSSGGGTSYSVAVGNNEYVYVNSNQEKYTFNASTGELVNREEYYSSALALDPYGNTLQLNHQKQSLSKDTHYAIDINGTITVSELSYDGEGNYSKTQLKNISGSSYESNIYDYDDGSAHHIVEAASDDYVVVTTRIDRGTEDNYDMHVVNRSTGDSVYEIEYTDRNGEAVVKPNGTIVLNTLLEPDTSAQGEYNETYVEINSDGEVVTEITENAADIDHDFFRNSWATNLTYTPIGEFEISIEKASLYEYNNSYEITVYNESGEKIYHNDSAKFGSNYIDAYGGSYDIKVDGVGIDAKRVNDTTIYHRQTASQTYSMEYVGTGKINITSVTDNNNTELDNWSVEIRNNGEVVHSSTNTTAPEEVELTAQETYTVEVSKLGYITENQSYTVYENETTHASFTLEEESTDDGSDDSDNTTTDDSDDGVEAIVGGDGSSGVSTDVLAVVVGVGGSGFLIFLLVAALAFRQLRRQSFALFMIMLVLVSAVGPMMVGQATAQTDSTPPDEAADLLVFTAFEDRDGQPVGDIVYAVDPSTDQTAWTATLNNSGTGDESAIPVASDETANQVYAASIDPNNTIHIYAIDSATGEIVEAHETNISTDQLGRTAVADNGKFYINTPETTYEFDFISDSLTELYDYPYPPVGAYDMGVQDGNLQQAAYTSDGGYASVYDGEENTDNINEDLDHIKYTSEGYLYETSAGDLEFYKNGSTTWSEVLTDGYLRAGASDGNQVYAKIGDRLRRYGTTANSEDATLYTAPSYENTSYRLSTLEYDAGYIHDFETRQGTTENLTSDTPTLVYRMHDPADGSVVYSTEIAHDSNYHRSVAIVHNTDSVTAIIGSGDTDYSVDDVLGEFLPTEYILAGLVILSVLFVGVVLILWQLVKMPVRVISAPLRFLIWLVKLVMP
jgi:hypothetical protein